MKTSIGFLAAVAAMSALPALADVPGGITLGNPVANGTGCPIGSVAAALTEDGRSLAVLFSQYTVEAGGSSGRDRDQKTCNVVIPIHVSQGYSVSLVSVDYRGFNSLPYGAQSQFYVDYFFTGNHGPGFQKTFYGALNEPFLLSNTLPIEAQVWSACGADADLRINTRMFVATNNRYEQSMASVDSADVHSSLVYKIQWKQCNGGGSQPYPGNDGGGNGGWDPGYPGSGSYTGNCIIDRDPYNSSRYLVRDRYQDLIGTAYSYEEALSMARQADADGRCVNGASSGYPGGGGWGGGAGPGYGGGRTVCSINVHGRIFNGSGWGSSDATAAARDQCMRAYGNSYVCNSAPPVCRTN